MPTRLLLVRHGQIAANVDAIHHLRDGRIVRTERHEAPMLVGGPLRAQQAP